jgi:hypothetical protein
MDGDALVLTVLHAPGGPGGTRGNPLPTPGSVFQTMKMSVEGDQLTLEWSREQFAATLSYDRQE